jgi:hypothetical protein
MQLGLCWNFQHQRLKLEDINSYNFAKASPPTKPCQIIPVQDYPYTSAGSIPLKAGI